MSDNAVFLSSIEVERGFDVSRFVVQRAALRGEIRFRNVPGGRTEYAVDDVRRFASEWTLRRSGRARGRTRRAKGGA